MTFSRLEDELIRARVSLQDAHDRLYYAKVAALKVSLGDIVKGRKGEPMLVRKIGRLGDEPTLYGVARKLDGTWGNNVRRIYVRPETAEIIGRDHDYACADGHRVQPGDVYEPELQRDPHSPRQRERRAHR